MYKLITLTAFLGYVAAAPLLYTHEEHVPVIHALSPSKTTITKNSQVVNHGGHHLVHVPVHDSVHLVHPVHVAHESVHIPQKSYHLTHESVHIPHESVHIPHESYHLTHESVHIPHESVHIPHESVVVHQPAKSSQYFKLENTQYHVPKVAVHKVASVPVVHTPVYHAPLLHTHVSRSGDSAVSHQSSDVHETVHEVKSLPLYTLHH